MTTCYYCPACGEHLPFSEDDPKQDAEGWPICCICDDPIPANKKRAFIEEESGVFILCEDCVKWSTSHGDKSMRLPKRLLKELV